MGDRSSTNPKGTSDNLSEDEDEGVEELKTSSKEDDFPEGEQVNDKTCKPNNNDTVSVAAASSKRGRSVSPPNSSRKGRSMSLLDEETQASIKELTKTKKEATQLNDGAADNGY